MAAPTNSLNLDDAVQRYLAGETPPQIRAATGVSSSVLFRERTRRGIPPQKTIRLSGAELVESYQRGESELSLAARYGVSRNVIRRHLLEQGCDTRGRSDASFVRAAKMTAEERAAQAEAAHDAVRGVEQTEEQLLARALGVERVGKVEPGGEQAMLGWLTERGETPIPQKAVGKYNVDFAVGPVAVEILGGGWHSAKATHARRTPYILNEGWAMLFVWNHEGRSALSERAADEVVAFANQVRRDPSLIGEYRVIAGNGETLARGRVEDRQFTLVPPPRGRGELGP